MNTTLKAITRGLLLTGVLVTVTAVSTGCATTDATTAHRELIKQKDSDQRVGQEAPNEKTLYSMAKIYISQGKTRQGELILIRAINEFPEYTPLYAELANVYMNDERVEDARVTLKTAVEKNDLDPLILNNLGICELILGDFQEAEAHFNRAVQLVPQEKRYTANLALALGMNGDLLGSQRTYRKILSQEKVDHNLNVIAKMNPKEDGGLELFDLHFE
jgi:Flp pilus assembly protein TadD